MNLLLRSLSWSQSIRQRLRRRTVILFFNLHWNSQIHVYRSQGESNLSPLQKTPLLQHSMLSSSEALIQIHRVVTDLSHQSRCALSRDWVASKVAVHEDGVLVNMFLSSKSQRCFGLSHQIPRCTFQREKSNSRGSLTLLSQMFRCFSKIQSFLGQV